MVKTICKKMLPIMLALTLIMSVMPLGFMASATTVNVLDGQLTFTDTANSISASGTSVTATAKGGLMNKKTNTITITNETGEQKKLSFSYSVSKSNSFNIDNTVTATSGNYTKTLAAGGTVKITMVSNSGFSNTTATLSITDITLESVSNESKVTFDFDETLGSVTANGTAVADGEEITVSLVDGATIVATPNSNVTFLGFVDGESGEIISTAASYAFNPTENVTVKAMFMDKNSTKPYFMLGGLSSKSASSGFLGLSKINYYTVPSATHYFDDFTAAVNASAANGVSKAVVLLNNATLPAGDYTIPAGVTLVIPFDAENTVYKTQVQGREHASDERNKFNVNIYRNLTLASGVNLTVNGDICLPAKHLYAQGSQIGGGSSVDNIPMITMEENSTITVNNGGAVYAYGYITGKGTLTAKNGATIYENFQINDFRGGTQSTDMENGVFPVAQYFIQNIEVLMKLEYGAKEYSYTTIYMQKADFGSAVNFIGPSNSMFNLTSGYVTKFYDGSTDRLIVDLYGDLTVSPVTLDIGGSDINSKNYELPINNNLTLTAHSGSNITMGQDIALLPSAELIIEDGAKCTIGKGVSVYIYDVDQWGNYTGATDLPVNPVFYAPGRTCGLRTMADLVDAKVQLDGYIDASQGYVYSTAGGANIISTGTGTAILNKGTQAVTYQLIQKTVTYVEIPLIPVVFKNADGSDFNTATDTYNYVDGKWTCTNHNYTTEASDPTCTAPGHTKEYCVVCGNVKTDADIPATGHNYKPVVTDPTCEDKGYTTYTCDKCGDSYVADYVDALGHKYTTETFDATCTEDGKVVYTCTTCGDTYEEEIKAEGHKYTTETFDATCTEDGKVVYTCACGDTYEEAIKAEGHKYTTVVTDPTCEDKGYTTHTCDKCGDSYVDTYVDALGHKYTTETFDATCTEDGKVVYTCTTCGDTYEEEIKAEGHKYTTVVTDPTCEDKGYTTYTCDKCGDSYVADYVDALGHKYTTETFDATCTEDGKVVYTCTACGDTYEEEIKAEGHKYTTVVTDPTCEDKGYTTYTCDKCGDNYVADYVDALGHKYTTETFDATCTEDGKVVYTCTTCGDTYEEEIKAEGHNYKPVVTDPTCEDKGYTTYTCDKCGDNYVADYVDALGHTAGDWEVVTEATVDADGLKVKKCACGKVMEEKVIPRVLNFRNKTLSLQSNISIIFRVDPVYFTKHGYSNPVVTFNFLGVDYPVTEYTVNASGLYEYAFNVVAPHQMKEMVYATFSAEYEGVVYTSAAQEYSIYTYCNNQITKNSANAAYKKVMALLVDILNYGAAAQTYQNYKVTNLANAELTAAQKALGNQDVITYTDEKQLKNEIPANGIADIKVVGLTLQDSVVMNFKFELLNGAAKDGLVAVITAAGRTWEIEASEFVYESSSKRWIINFNGLNPAQMREKVSICLKKDGVIVSDTATYSVESYGLSSAAKGNAKLAALVEAMARYGRSAKAYNG